MVVDVVQCAPNAPQLKRVIQYVCGNSLVCENLQDARRIAFDGPERLQVSTCNCMPQDYIIISGRLHFLSFIPNVFDLCYM